MAPSTLHFTLSRCELQICLKVAVNAHSDVKRPEDRTCSKLILGKDTISKIKI